MLSCMYLIGMENPYEILECSRFDSLEMIKRNGRRLMFKYHPDKNNSGEYDTFVKIQKAYDAVLKEKETEEIIMKQFREVSCAMLAFFNVYMSYCLTKPKTIQINLEVSLGDVIQRSVKRIVYKRYVSGKLQRETIYIDLSTFQKTYVFEELGDENVFMKSFGDVEVNLKLSKSDIGDDIGDDISDVEVVDDYTVRSTMKITLYEYFYGVNISKLKRLNVLKKHIPHLDGEEMTVTNLIEDTRLHIKFKLNLSIDRDTLDSADFERFIKRHFHS